MFLGCLDIMDTRLRFELSGVRIPEDPKYFSPPKRPYRLLLNSNGKGKAVPLQTWSGPEGSRKLRFLDFSKCVNSKGKGKAVPLQAWSGPEFSRKLSFPYFMTTAQDGGKVVSLTHRPPLYPRKYTWYSFLLEAYSTPGP
jgi:hypothetical protein